MSVAIRAITRLQDADDVNVTLGAGVDEYALTWDNDTARFVLRAPFAGLLATGATTGATSQAQAFTNGIIGPSWKPSADSTTALQLQNASGTSVLNVDTTNARVGIGTASPGVRLHISASSLSAISYPGIYVSNTNVNNPGGSGYNFAVATFSAGNNAIDAQFGANFGTGSLAPWTESGFMITTRTNHPIVFWTGATTTEKMRITNGGNVGIGTASPAALVHADQSSSTGAVPVLTVDQADVSEEFIRFIGTSTTDATQSLVDAANMTTPGSIVGWLKIYVQDDQATNPITDGAYYVPFYSAPTA